jgi:DNA-binding LytR/AlgR family response regulator
VNPLKAIAIDDEDHALELIEMYAEKSSLIELKAKANSHREALEQLEVETFDIVFLDIQIPEITGLQLMDLFPVKLPVVITSAYPQYAVDGYKYDVYDYLLKPFSFNRFEEAVNRVIEKKRGEMLRTSEQFITVKGDGRGNFRRIRVKDILYVEGMGNYAQFYVSDGRVVSLIKMNEVESILPAGFVRVHRSFIVNLNKVHKLEGNTLLIDSKTIPVGSTYRKSVKRSLGL